VEGYTSCADESATRWFGHTPKISQDYVNAVTSYYEANGASEDQKIADVLRRVRDQHSEKRAG